MGEVICCELEERNAHDPFSVVLKNAGTGNLVQWAIIQYIVAMSIM